MSMHHATGETVDYWEGFGNDAEALLNEAATVVRNSPDNVFHFTLTFCPNPDTMDFGYMAVLLVHG